VSEGPWRIEVSNTYRGIYVMRYLLFSGGMAIAAALLERSIVGPRLPGIGLLVGLALGFVLFRSQLRPLRFPRLAMSRETLYVLRRDQTFSVPWKELRGVTPRDGNVELECPGETVTLVAKELGSKAENLANRLSRLQRDELFRSALPDEVRARAMLGL